MSTFRAVLFSCRDAIYFIVMFSRKAECSIRVVGVALEGRQGSPAVVSENLFTGEFLSLPVDPFDAEMIIRAYLDDDTDTDTSGESHAIAWLADLMNRNPPRRARIESCRTGEYRIRFSFLPGTADRYLGPGEGLALCRRLSVPLCAERALFEATREDVNWLSRRGAFTGDFLYLSPPQYAPGIPVE